MSSFLCTFWEHLVFSSAWDNNLSLVFGACKAGRVVLWYKTVDFLSRVDFSDPQAFFFFF